MYLTTEEYNEMMKAFKKNRMEETKEKIGNFLTLINATEEKPKKRAIAIELLQYLREDCIWYFDMYDNFRKVVVDKCKEFQQIDHPELYKACQDLLDIIEKK